MNSLIYKCITFLFQTVTIIECSRILAVFPVPAAVRRFVFRPLITELAHRGHEIVLITPYVSILKENLHENIVLINTASEVGANIKFANHQNYELELSKSFIKQIQSKQVQDALQTYSFDLLICDSDIRSILVLSDLYNLPVIQISTSGVGLNKYDITGEPNPYHPSSQKNDQLTIWETVINAFNHYKYAKLLTTAQENENDLIKEHFGFDIPDLKSLYENVNFLFMNLHPIWGGNYPVPQNIQLLGGLHLQPEKPLPITLESYLNKAANGVILVSFGTVIKLQLPLDKQNLIIKVLSELPYEVLLQSDITKHNDLTPNINIRKWIPQSDVLRHPNVKLFITHAGTLSTFESIDAGVPLVGIPQTEDQLYNADKYLEHGIGLMLHMNSLTEAILKSAIDHVLKNESYYRNTARLGAIMRDQPQSPLARAVWWTEYTLRHSSNGLRLPIPTAISPVRNYEMEWIIAFTITSIVFIILSLVSVYFVVTYGLRKGVKVKLY